MWTYRVKYEKKGLVRFTSHLDTMRALKRALQRADAPVAFTEGFNPRPKLSMGPALPLGCESKCEMVDIVLTASLAPEELRDGLARTMPEGLNLLETDRVEPTTPKLSRASSVYYMVELPCEITREEAESLVKEFREKDSVLIERMRKGKPTAIDVRQLVCEAAVASAGGDAAGWLSVEISISQKGTCGPVEVARAVFGISPERAKRLKAVRTDIKFEEQSTA
jgi:radical SAM-linked protein